MRQGMTASREARDETPLGYRHVYFVNSTIFNIIYLKYLTLNTLGIYFQSIAIGCHGLLSSSTRDLANHGPQQNAKFDSGVGRY